MAKRRGTTSTVWSGWRCVKKMRSTVKGSRPERSMPRRAPEPRSKTSICPPVRTTTQLWRRSRRGTTVPVPTTVIFMCSSLRSSQHVSLSARYGLWPPLVGTSACQVLFPGGCFSVCRLLFWLSVFERPCEAGDGEQGATQDVRGPVCTDVDPACGGCGEEDQDRDPGWPVGPQYVDGSEQEDRAQDVPAGVRVRRAHVEQ